MRILICGKNYRQLGIVATNILFTKKDTLVEIANSIEEVCYCTKSARYDKIMVIDTPSWIDGIKRFYDGDVASVQIQESCRTSIDQAIASFIIQYGIKQWYLFFLQYIILLVFRILDLIGQKTVVCELFVSRIGHLVYNTCVAISHKLKGKYRHVIGIYDKGFVASPTILCMLKDFIPITSSKLLYKILTLPAIINSKYYIDGHYLLEAIYPHFKLARIAPKFSREQECAGRKFLRSLGIGENDWFICVNNRDERYLSTALPVNEWDYHRFRNCDIKKFRKAIDYIVSKGGHVIRIGMYPKEKLVENERVHDISDFDDFYQIYCMANCKFYLGVYTGLGVLAFLFGRPQCSVNLSQLELLTIFSERDIILPKHFWHNNLGRYLTLEEVLISGNGRNTRAEQFIGIDVEENTEEEIYLACKEMLEGSLELNKRQKEFIDFLASRDFISKGIRVRLANCYNSAPMR